MLVDSVRPSRICWVVNWAYDPHHLHTCQTIQWHCVTCMEASECIQFLQLFILVFNSICHGLYFICSHKSNLILNLYKMFNIAVRPFYLLSREWMRSRIQKSYFSHLFAKLNPNTCQVDTGKSCWNNCGLYFQDLLKVSITVNILYRPIILRWSHLQDFYFATYLLDIKHSYGISMCFMCCTFLCKNNSGYSKEV